jgi:myo-inositol-1(or 4)-monophosphatase
MKDWLIEMVQGAGQIAEEYLAHGFSVKYKEDGTIVTSADLHIDRYLRGRIHGRFPEDGILTEESVDNPARITWRRVWIVDPIDGTTAFAEKRPEFGILVALCIDGVAVESVAHFPRLSLTLYGNTEQGALVNGRRVKVSTTHDTEIQIASSSHAHRHLHTASTMPQNSALALVQVIMGEIDACIVTCGPNAGEHDYAWASCALTAAGGRLTDAAGRELRYNKINRSMPPIIVGSNGQVHDEVLRLVNDTYFADE